MRPLRTKTIGILGGMSDKATVEYYRMINAGVNKRLGGWDIAETITMGVNFGNIEYFIRNDMWDEAQAYLIDKAQKLELAGADVVLCVSNTMHRVLECLPTTLSVPFLHIVDPTGEAIKAQGLKKVGLLGTKPVMSADYIKARYKEKFDIDVISPDLEQQTLVDGIIFNELVKGVISDDSRKVYVDICQSLVERGAEGVILGCTEIFLLITQGDTPEIPQFNTTSLHAAAAVEFALSGADK